MLQGFICSWYAWCMHLARGAGASCMFYDCFCILNACCTMCAYCMHSECALGFHIVRMLLARCTTDVCASYAGRTCVAHTHASCMRFVRLRTRAVRMLYAYSVHVGCVLYACCSHTRCAHCACIWRDFLVVGRLPGVCVWAF